MGQGIDAAAGAVSNTKFWLAVGIISSMVVLLAVYLFRSDKPDAGIVVALVGVITLVAGGYFTSNVVASGQAMTTTTTTSDPPSTTTETKGPA